MSAQSQRRRCERMLFISTLAFVAPITQTWRSYSLGSIILGRSPGVEIPQDRLLYVPFLHLIFRPSSAHPKGLSCALSLLKPPISFSTKHAVALTLTTTHPITSVSLICKPTTAFAPLSIASFVILSIAWSRAWYKTCVKGFASPQDPVMLLDIDLRKDFGPL